MKKGKKGLLAALLTAALLCCAAALAAQGLFTRCTLRFVCGGTETELRLRPGEYPSEADCPSPGEGLRLVCWLDSSGAEAGPFSRPADGDAEYTALLAPELAEDIRPWLEPDALGLIHPDRPVTAGEFAAGVSALFADGYRADTLSGSGPVSMSDAGAALEGLFAPSRTQSLSGVEELTRLEAAELLLSLAGLSPDEGGGAVFPDLDPARAGAAALAACSRQDGRVRYEEGFVNLEGYLYRVDANGLFVMDGEYGGLYFGPDGRYTSGSAELDALVAEVLSGICAEHPDRGEALEAAYEYVRDGFTYLRRNYYEIGASGWEVEEAVTMLSTGRGNCYNYAAAFWALARGLGCDAEAVSGCISSRRQPHGWVMIDGLYYDPETEMAYRRDRVYDRHMFAMEESRASQWNYEF